MNEGWQARTNEGQVGRKTAGGDEPRLVGTNHGTRGRTTAVGDEPRHAGTTHGDTFQSYITV